jgi:DNA-directed RNA polymerase subunit M/transcription elongation factor TFIIS
MPISVKCPDCSQGLKAPDALAGKKAKCPKCGGIVPIPAAESDAIAVVNKRWPPVKEEIEEFDEFGDAEDYEDTPDETADERRPCPMCGERILAWAVKCRYCGEIVDDDAALTVRRLKKKKKKSGSGDRALLVSFRRHSHWTGGFVIFIAACVGFTGLVMFAAGAQGARPPGLLPPPGFGQQVQFQQIAGVVGAVFLVLAVVWLVLGIFICRKHLWASYATTVLTAISVIDNITNKNVSGAIGAFVILAESLIIGNKGRELQRRGIPLDEIP